MDDNNAHEPHQISLEFYVICETNFGEQVRICGNSIETGNWNPLNGHKLVTDESIYPRWKSYVPLIIRNCSKLEFKACKVSSNEVMWQRHVLNRQILTDNPSVLQFKFDQTGIKITPKRVMEIDCREGTFQIIHQMENSQTSSIEFKINYPLQYYFQNEQQKQQSNDRKYSDGDLSSNLISLNGQNMKDQNQQSQMSQKQFQRVKVTQTHYPELFKVNSIKPKDLKRKSGQSTTLNIKGGIQGRLRRQKSKIIKRSQSSSKSKKQELSSPVIVHVPGSQQKRQKKKVVKTITPCEPNNSVSTEEQSEDNKSTSTVKQYDTEDEYVTTRDDDVVIQGPQYGDV